MGQAYLQVFKRVEKKYLVSSEQYDELMGVLLMHMKKDNYGEHTICNIYYDNECNELIRTSIDKPVYKEKFRIRSYGVPTIEDTVFFEIKKKSKGVVYKRRVPFKLREAKKVMNAILASENLQGIVCDRQDYDISNRQIMREIEYIIKHYELKPDTYIAYDRIALYGIDDPQLRVTFDRNVRTRKHDLSLENGDYGETILDEGYYLMEIKTNGAMPMWLASKLSDMQMYPYSFSKFGTAYKKRLLGGNNDD